MEMHGVQGSRQLGATLVHGLQQCGRIRAAAEPDPIRARDRQSAKAGQQSLAVEGRYAGRVQAGRF
jgi:hypothetical protein